MKGISLLAGPQQTENLAEQRRRLGRRPAADGNLIGSLERSGLAGRGGASFPAGLKWRSVAGQPGGPAIVIANGAEGEPLSRKDHLLMAWRPHLVIDGAQLAAEAVGAERVYLYVGEAHAAAVTAMTGALAERPLEEQARTRLVVAPTGYVAGEETAAVHFLNSGVATPTATPPRPFEKGVEGRPTLVQNVESLAHAALIARFGDAWFRSLGSGPAAGTLLLTVSGAVSSPGVIEVASGTALEDVLEAAGTTYPPRAILVGGYFGGWIDAAAAAGVSLDPQALRAAGRSLGCGVVFVLDGSASPVAESARIMRYLAGESAAQCGPCFFGLRSLAAAVTRLAEATADSGDLARLHRWAAMVKGRGACRHPDGAAAFLHSALDVFEAEFSAAARLAA